jgi:hypothetical protein
MNELIFFRTLRKITKKNSQYKLSRPAFGPSSFLIRVYSVTAPPILTVVPLRNAEIHMGYTRTRLMIGCRSLTVPMGTHSCHTDGSCVFRLVSSLG